MADHRDNPIGDSTMRRLIVAGVLGLLIALSAIPTLASTRPGCQVPNPHTSVPARCPQ